MNPERLQFLNLRQPPGRLNAEEAAWFLGFLPHEMPILMGARLLKPLGHPAHNGCKYFSSAVLEELRRDPAWLAQASDTIVKHWKGKTGRRDAALRRRNGKRIPPR